MARGVMGIYESGKRKWAKIKSNPELYEKSLKRAKKYRQKNKEKASARTNNWRKEMREVAMSIGNCTRCFKEKDNPKLKTCSKCREYNRNYDRYLRKP
jgi:hypothetical protein